LYVKPRVLDLSGLVALGDELTGFCYNGTSPIDYTCTDGPNPSQATGLCSPTGLMPFLGGCDYGNNAAEGCQSGSYVANCANGPTFLPTSPTVFNGSGGPGPMPPVGGASF